MTESSTTASADHGPFASDHPPPLDFESWSVLSASLLRRETDEQLHILQAADIDVALWDACNLFWLEQLAHQVARGNRKLAARYGTRCASDLAARSGDPEAEPKPVLLEPDLDATAFMTALHDDTVVPFASPVAGQELPFEKTGLARAQATQDTLADEAHPDAGQTLEVAVVAPLSLPFEKP